MNVTLDIPDDLVFTLGRQLTSHATLQQIVIDALKDRIQDPAREMYKGMSRAQLLESAMTSLKNTPVGSCFLLRALLPEQAWDVLSDGDRRQLGKELKAAANESGYVKLEQVTTMGDIYKRTAKA